MSFTQIAGHIGKDPETRYTPDGKKVTSFSVATNMRKAGQDVTLWWRVTIWGEQFDKMLPYMKKGSAVIVVGDMDEPKIYNNQVQLGLTARMISFSPFGKGGDKSGGQGGGQQQEQQQQRQNQPDYEENYAGSSKGQGKSADPEDDLPF